VNADAAAQLRLLELQALDAQLARLASRRRGLPALAAMESAAEQVAHWREEEVRSETAATDFARAAAKELESLQSEITSLARRQDALEEEELELLEQREAAEKSLEEARAAVAEADAALVAATGERDREWAAIDEEMAALGVQRVQLVATLPTDLVSLYDRIRVDRGGVGAAALLRRRCEGCHLELAGTELSELVAAPPDAVWRHEECGRILVRTAESGL